MNMPTDTVYEAKLCSLIVTFQNSNFQGQRRENIKAQL
jgi:hypothetical protein